MKKNILVTGGFGFLAGYIIRKLSKNNNVISIDKKKNFYRYKNKKPKDYKGLGSFNNKVFITNYKKHRINVIFHLGATTQVLNFYKNQRIRMKII